MLFASQVFKLTSAHVTIDWDKRTAQVDFASKPADEVREALKRAGFRYSDGRWSGPMQSMPHLEGAALRVLIPASWYEAIRKREITEAAAEVKIAQAWADKFDWRGAFVTRTSSAHIDYTWARWGRSEAADVIAAAARIATVPAREIESVTDYDVVPR